MLTIQTKWQWMAMDADQSWYFYNSKPFHSDVKTSEISKIEWLTTGSCLKIPVSELFDISSELFDIAPLFNIWPWEEAIFERAGEKWEQIAP